MPPPIPDRFRLELRIGRDGDIEDWLATDASLDRPVLVRIIGPDTTPERVKAFFEAAQEISSVSHRYLTALYTAGNIPHGAFAVFEWAGGATLANRIASGETIHAWDFLPNAAGLAGALAAMHAEGIVHGAIDTRSVFYTVSHPAKLGGIGRRRVTSTALEDVRSLARVLEEGLTGVPPGGPPPSEVVDGLSPEVDRILRAAQRGELSSTAFLEALEKAPSPIRQIPEPPGWSRRLLMAASALVLAALILVVGGRWLSTGSGGIRVPIDFREISPVPGEAMTTTTTIPDMVPLEILSAVTVDPFGQAGEHDSQLRNLYDDDPTTAWTTEIYNVELSVLKPGVGIALRVSGTPDLVEFQGITSDTSYEFGWMESRPVSADSWEVVSGGRTVGSTLSIQLPQRTDGWWVLWLTSLPITNPPNRSAAISEVRFLEWAP